MKETAIVILTIALIYLLFIKDTNKTYSRWDIVTLANKNYTFKEIVNILGVPDEIDLLKGYAIWIDKNNKKVLRVGIDDKGGKIDLENIKVSDFFIKNSLNNADIKKTTPCFKQLSKFDFENKSIKRDCK